MVRFVHGERPRDHEKKEKTFPNLSAPQTRAQCKPPNKPSNSQHKAGGRRGQITIARNNARRWAFAKGAQNKPLNQLPELTSSLKEAPDAHCLFRRGPDVTLKSKSPHCAVSSVN